MSKSSKMFSIKSFFAYCVFIIYSSCIPSHDNRLGTFGMLVFPFSKSTMEKTIDTLFYEYPQYCPPDKWHSLTVSNNAKNLIEGWIFYFGSHPEEMYGATLIGDSTMLSDKTTIRIAIRTVYNGQYWMVESALSSAEKKRIEARFDTEIISKLEKISGFKASRPIE